MFDKPYAKEIADTNLDQHSKTSTTNTLTRSIQNQNNHTLGEPSNEHTGEEEAHCNENWRLSTKDVANVRPERDDDWKGQHVCTTDPRVFSIRRSKVKDDSRKSGRYYEGIK